MSRKLILLIMKAGDHVEDIQHPIAPVEPEDRQPDNGPAPDVPVPRRSATFRRPTAHYGDPVEISETIRDEDLFD